MIPNVQNLSRADMESIHEPILAGAALLKIASWTLVGLPLKALEAGKVAAKAIEILRAGH